MDVAVLAPNGKISTNCRLVKLPDVNNRAIVEQSGKLIEVHRTRILSPDVVELLSKKALLLQTPTKSYGICPQCQSASIVSHGTIKCDTHGVFEVQDIPSLTKSGKLSKESKMTTQPAAEPVAVEKDLVKQILEMGFEVWMKSNVPFTDPNITLNAYVIVGDDPGRKLCFNTYNGSLGKKKTVEALELEGFGKGPTQQSYAVADTAKERDKLAKKGYHKVTGC